MAINSFMFIHITYLYEFSDRYSSHEYCLVLYVGSLNSHSKSFLFEVASCQISFSDKRSTLLKTSRMR